MTVSDADTEQRTPSSRRPVRSYVIRGGRLTASQRRALEVHSSDFVVDYRPEIVDTESLFGNQHDLIIEIGFGMGDSLLEMAARHPERNYLGIEVHRPGIGKLLTGIVREQLGNLRIINHDAREVLEHCFKSNSLAGVQIFFPDPWHKKRHHKRRLIQPEFVRLVVDRLRKDGLFHLATDWQPYAEQMLEVLEDNPELVNLAGAGNFSPPGERPPTRFEKRGRKLGHEVWDLQFARR